MKKFLFVMILALVLSLAFVSTAFADLPRVVDEANLLTEDEEQALEKHIDKIIRKQKFDVVIVTTNSCDGMPLRNYADDYYDYNGYGIGKGHDGVLFLVSMEDRECHIFTTGFGITALTDWGIDYISNEIQGDFSDGYYYEGLSSFVDLTEEFVVQAKTGEPYDVHNKRMTGRDYLIRFIIAAVIGLIIAFIVTGIMRSKLKTKRPNPLAHEYMQGFEITNSRDMFLYRDVKKIPKPQNDNRGGGGGSSIHIGSSGRSHGGGGFKF